MAFVAAMENFNDGSLNKQVYVYFMLGVSDLSRKGLSYWDGANLGEIVWKEDFDLSPE